MRRQHGRAVRRAVRWALAAALLWFPTAGSAATWVGGTKEKFVCPGLGHTVEYFNFTLDMQPGFGLGTLTYAGAQPIDVVAEWTNDGRWAYFTATGTEPNGGPLVFYGYTRGARMRGWVVYQSFGTDGCMSMGSLRAWGQ